MEATKTNETAAHVIESLKALNPYELANMAGITVGRARNEDGTLSEGLDMLDTVRVTLIDVIRYEGIDTEAIRDNAGEYADSAVPVYTYRIFSAVLDLCAWSEDVEDYFGGIEADFEQMARAALYMQATSLVHALADFIDEAVENFEN